LDVAERMSGLRGMDGVDIKTRKWRLRTFKAVFVGREVSPHHLPSAVIGGGAHDLLCLRL